MAAKENAGPALRYSPNVCGLPVLEKRLHIPRNDPVEQSNYIIFSSHQCTVMVPDRKGQNPLFNSVLTHAQPSAGASHEGPPSPKLSLFLHHQLRWFGGENLRV